jgi:hypothetical protein
VEQRGAVRGWGPEEPTIGQEGESKPTQKSETKRFAEGHSGKAVPQNDREENQAGNAKSKGGNIRDRHCRRLAETRRQGKRRKQQDDGEGADYA